MLKKGRENIVDVVSFDTGSNIMILRDQNGTEYEMLVKEINGKPVTWVPNWYPLNYLDYFARSSNIKINGKVICKIGKELENYDVDIPFYNYVEEILDNTEIT